MAAHADLSQAPTNSPCLSRAQGRKEIWTIEPTELAICKDKSGKDLLLGEGSFGKSLKLKANILR